MEQGIQMAQHSGLWRAALGLVIVGTLGLGACYSALDPAADNASQYANEPNATLAGTAFVPLPEQAWLGLNLMPHDANTTCVDGVVASGTGLSLQVCSGAVLQRFKWAEGVLSVAGNRCLDLDISGGVPKAGTAAMLKPCDPNATTQLWTYGNGWIFPEVVGRTTPPSLCLSTIASSASVGDTLQLVPCNQTPAPLTWDMSLYDGNSWIGFPISSAVNAHYCFDDYGNATADGSPVVTYVCHGSQSQGMTMRAGALMMNGVCLDVTGDVGADNTPISMHSCVAGAENELFAIEHGRIYTYSGPNVGRCIEIPYADPTAQKQLDVFTCSAQSSLTAVPHMHWVLGYDVR